MSVKKGPNVFNVTGSISGANACTASDTMTIYYNPPPSPAQKNAGPPPTCNGTNPVNGATGNKYQVETDYQGTGQAPLELKRYYNSSYDNQRTLGPNWQHSYDRQLIVNSTRTEAYTIRPDGRAYRFARVLTTGPWLSDGDVNDKLLDLTAGGWRLILGDNDTLENYDSSGRLVTMTPRGGIAQNLVYDALGRLSSVNDGYGHILKFNYDSTLQTRLISVTDPAGKFIQYSYGESPYSTNPDDLTSVKYPDTKIRKYHYNELPYTSGADLPHKLTGITDENNVRFAIYRYDSQGRGVGTEHAGGVEKASLVYNADGSTTVTDVLGVSRTYNFQTILGVLKNTGVSQPCPSCGSDTANTRYDSNGNVSSRTDFKGNLTCYAYNARNLETVRVEGFAPGSVCPANLATYTPTSGTVQRKITTEWHTTWRVPTRIAEPERITTNTWGNVSITCGAVGALCSKKEQATSDDTGGSGFAAAAVDSPRINTYTYNVRGQRLTADGPRTDVNDVTTFAYYADNDLTVANRKLLQTVTNALGHVTRYEKYDKHGQAQRITDANGVITDFVRDARNRIYTLTTTAPGVTARSTQFIYYNNGLLKNIITPDQGTILYGYDGAHRLKSITRRRRNVEVHHT